MTRKPLGSRSLLRATYYITLYYMIVVVHQTGSLGEGAAKGTMKLYGPQYVARARVVRQFLSGVARFEVS